MGRFLLICFLLLGGVLPPCSTVAAADYDVVVYGGTSAGVIAAVQARKMGKSAVLVGPDKHLGGLSSGGLGFTDTGNKAVIGGLAREFYHRIWQHYQKPEGWKWQKQLILAKRIFQGREIVEGFFLVDGLSQMTPM